MWKRWPLILPRTTAILEWGDRVWQLSFPTGLEHKQLKGDGKAATKKMMRDWL